MTAGPIGFESARTFYLDPTMTFWRQFSVKGLIIGSPLFVVSVGCMLADQASCSFADIFGGLVLFLFLAFALCLCRIGQLHQERFRRKYYAGTDLRPLLTNMEVPFQKEQIS